MRKLSADAIEALRAAGRKGAAARAAKLSAARRREIGVMGAAARWSKKPANEEDEDG